MWFIFEIILDYKLLITALMTVSHIGRSLNKSNEEPPEMVPVLKEIPEVSLEVQMICF